jgi:hypothetical protein
MDKTKAFHRRIRNAEDNAGRNVSSVLKAKYGYGEGSWENTPMPAKWESVLKEIY